MINRTLFSREMKANLKILLIFVAVLSMYSFVIIMMFDPKLGESLKLMSQSMPDIFAALGMTVTGTTLTEFLANYLYGFILIVFPMIFIVVLSYRLIARYVDRGIMAYLLATPNKRVKIATTQAMVLVTCCFGLVLYVTIFCVLISHGIFSWELNIRQFLGLNMGLYGVFIFLGGLCFLSSCIFNEAKRAIGISTGLCVIFTMIKMLSQVGKNSEKLKYITPLSLFDPANIVAGATCSYVYVLILYITGFLFYGIGIVVFCRKDLPI